MNLFLIYVYVKGTINKIKFELNQECPHLKLSWLCYVNVCARWLKVSALVDAILQLCSSLHNKQAGRQALLMNFQMNFSLKWLNKLAIILKTMNLPRLTMLK